MKYLIIILFLMIGASAFGQKDTVINLSKVSWDALRIYNDSASWHFVHLPQRDGYVMLSEDTVVVADTSIHFIKLDGFILTVEELKKYALSKHKQ